MAPAGGVVLVTAAARALGITPDHLRQLEYEGRVPVPPRDARGFRVYSSALIEEMRARLRPEPRRPWAAPPVARRVTVIRPDIHARFLAIVLRADARVAEGFRRLRSEPASVGQWSTSKTRRQGQAQRNARAHGAAGDAREIGGYGEVPAWPREDEAL